VKGRASPAGFQVDIAAQRAMPGKGVFQSGQAGWPAYFLSEPTALSGMDETLRAKTIFNHECKGEIQCQSLMQS